MNQHLQGWWWGPERSWYEEDDGHGVKQSKSPVPSSAHRHPTDTGGASPRAATAGGRVAGIDGWQEPPLPPRGGFPGAAGVGRDSSDPGEAGPAGHPHHPCSPGTLPSPPGLSLSSWTPAGSTPSPAPGTLNAGAGSGPGAPPGPSVWLRPAGTGPPAPPRGAASGGAPYEQHHCTPGGLHASAEQGLWGCL